MSLWIKKNFELKSNFSYYTIFDGTACNAEHQTSIVTITGFKNNKNLRSYSASVAFLDITGVYNLKKWREKPSYHLCIIKKDENSFKSKHFEEIHKKTKTCNSKKCNSRMVSSLKQCQV